MSALSHLRFPLGFLAAWKKRPVYLTPMAYQWCSAISEVVGSLDPNEVPVWGPQFWRIQPQSLATDEGLAGVAEREFSEVRPLGSKTYWRQVNPNAGPLAPWSAGSNCNRYTVRWEWNRCLRGPRHRTFSFLIIIIYPF